MVAPKALVAKWGLVSPWAGRGVRKLNGSGRRVSDGRGAGLGGVSQTACGAGPIFRGWTGRGHGDLDAAYGDAHQRPDLQEHEPDGAAGGVRKGGFGQAD